MCCRFCFCKKNKNFNLFNKIREKGIRFQRFYIIASSKSNELTILKLSTKEKSKMFKFKDENFDKILRAPETRKLLLSKKKLKFLRNCVQSKLLNSINNFKTLIFALLLGLENKVKQCSQLEASDKEDKDMKHCEWLETSHNYQIDTNFKIKEEPIETMQLESEGYFYTVVEIKPEVIYDQMESQQVFSNQNVSMALDESINVKLEKPENTISNEDFSPYFTFENKTNEIYVEVRGKVT